MATFESYGFVPLEPPSVELAASSTTVDEHRLLRFLDRDGSLLALRPDLTTAVARVVAQRYRDTAGVLRLAYFTSVFREERSMRGSEREYDQAGVELIGPSIAGGSPPVHPRSAGGAVADAEAIALLADALCRCGLVTAEIDVGHAGFLAGFLEDLSADARDDALARARAGDLLGLPNAELVRKAVRHRGELEPFLALRAELPTSSARALDELREVASLLMAAGVTLPVRYDLGLVAALPYYTGVVFQATAPGLGFVVASGGRYDGLLARFGADRPATGFGIAIPHLHQALVAAGWRVDDASPLVVLEGGAPGDALRAATALRREGVAVSIGAVADSAGRATLAVRVIDGARVERDGHTLAVGELAAELRGARR